MTLNLPRVFPGDIVRVAKLPKYWGATDIRDTIAMVIEIIADSNYCVIKTESGNWTVAISGLELISGSPESQTDDLCLIVTQDELD